MRQADAGVSGRDEHVVVTRIAADERQAVESFQDLSAPTVGEGLDHRKALPRPGLEPAVALRDVVGLSGLVIFPADEEALPALPHRLKPHVVKRVLDVPVKRARHGTLGHEGPDDVRHVRRLLRVDRDAVVDRAVRRHDDGPGGDLAVPAGDAGRRSGLDAFGVEPAENASTPAADGARESAEIAQGMKLSLAAEAHAGPRVERKLRPRHHRDVGSGSPGRRELLLQHLGTLVPSAEEESVHALELAGDLFAPGDLLDPIDRGGMARGREPRALRAAQPLDVGVSAIERRHEVGAGRAGHSAAQRAVVDDHDGPALGGEEVGGGQPGDSGPDHAHVGADVGPHRREFGRLEAVPPDRLVFGLRRFRHDSPRMQPLCHRMTASGSPAHDLQTLRAEEPDQPH